MQWLCGTLSQYTEEQYEAAYRALSPSRRKRIDRLHRSDDCLRSLLGELLLGELLRACGVENAVIESAENGQPFLRDSELYISIAHSGDRAACAVCERPVGIDIEQVLPLRARLLPRVCTKEELAYIAPATSEGDVTDPAVLRRFYEVWTAKEAYLKQCGTGITVDLRSINTLSYPRQVHYWEDYVLCIVR